MNFQGCFFKAAWLGWGGDCQPAGTLHPAARPPDEPLGSFGGWQSLIGVSVRLPRGGVLSLASRRGSLAAVVCACRAARSSCRGFEQRTRSHCWDRRGAAELGARDGVYDGRGRQASAWATCGRNDGYNIDDNGIVSNVYRS